MFTKYLVAGICIIFITFQSASANAVGGYVPINDKDLIFSYLPSTMKMERFGDSLYYVNLVFKGNFFQAMQFCKFHGMELVSIESTEENEFLFQHIQSFSGGSGELLFWSSGVKTEPDNRWVWMGTGKPITYYSWLAGQPGNTATERYMEIRFTNNYRTLVYNDQVIGQPNYVICEISVPKTVTF